jgi:hypothetical protein
MGNKRFNSFYESQLKSKTGFNFHLQQERENFIKLKYVELFFVDNDVENIYDPYFSFLKQKHSFHSSGQYNGDQNLETKAFNAAVHNYDIPLVAFYLNNGVKIVDNVIDLVRDRKWFALERYLLSWTAKDATFSGRKTDGFSTFRSAVIAPSFVNQSTFPFDGFVYKSDPKGRRYQRRYFELNDKGLFYSKQPNDTTYKGFIPNEEILSFKVIRDEKDDNKENEEDDPSSYSSATQQDGKSSKCYFDIITLNRTFHCFVDCEYVRDHWATAFEWNKKMVEWKKSKELDAIKEQDIRVKIFDRRQSSLAGDETESPIIYGTIKNSDLVVFNANMVYFISFELSKLLVSDEKLTSFTCIYNNELEIMLEFKNKESKLSFMYHINGDNSNQEETAPMDNDEFSKSLPVFMKTLNWLCMNSSSFPLGYYEAIPFENAIKHEEVLFSTNANEVALFVCRFVHLYFYKLTREEKDKVVHHLIEMIGKNSGKASKVSILDLTYKVADRFTKLITRSTNTDEDQDGKRTTPVTLPNDYFLKGLLTKDQKIDVLVYVYVEKRREPVKMKLSVPEDFKTSQFKSFIVTNHLDSSIDWTNYYFSQTMQTDKADVYSPGVQYERLVHPDELVKDIYHADAYRKTIEFKLFSVNMMKLKQFQSLKNSTYEGWLYKEGKKIKSWKKRFCVLHTDTLLYYKEPSSPTPLGSFVNIDRKKVWFVRNYQRAYNAFALCLFDEQKQTVRYLCAENEIEMLLWVFQLSQVCTK